MLSFLKRYSYQLATLTVVACATAKFLYSYFVFDIPLGYDVGMYRFLFLEYADALRTWTLPYLSPWASEYPPGLFVLVAPLINMGLSVDLLIGPIWNMFPVILLCVLAWITAQRTNAQTGICVLVIGVISQTYYDGFFAMYIKTYVAMLTTVLTYYLVEKMSPWFLVTAFLTIVIHQQTALVLCVALGVWWVCQFPTRKHERTYQLCTAAAVVLFLVALGMYLPYWKRAIWSPLMSVLTLYGDQAPSGTFPDRLFYVQTAFVTLLLGAIGFFRSYKQERCSLWQLSVLVCFVFVVLRLVFYKRFFLQLDFFLMPFAASALVWLWHVVRSAGMRMLIVIVLSVQCAISLQSMALRIPLYSAGDLDQIQSIAKVIPSNATIIALENISGPWLRGWLPHHRVGAPGLFDYPDWSYEDWRTMVDGTTAQRKALLSQLEGDVYFFVTQIFHQYYGERAAKMFSDPCLQPLSIAPVLLSTCSAS